MTTMRRWTIVVAVLLFLFGVGMQRASADDKDAATAPPSIRQGVLDLSGWDLAADGPVPLQGEWAFYWNRLLAPNEFATTSPPAPTGYFDVPSFWGGYTVDGKPLPRYGYATYRLVITGNRSPEPLGIKMMYAYSGSRIWVNGELVRSFGEPGRTAREEIPRFMASTVADIGRAGERIELVVELSNFRNPQGGLLSGFVLGTAERLDAMKQREVIEDSLVFGALLVMAVYHMVLYALRRKDKAPLHFALLCLCIAVRTLLSNSKFVLDLAPDLSWAWFGKLSYLTVYVGLFFLASFVYHLFPTHVAKPVLRTMQGFSALLTALVVLTDIRIYDSSLLLFEAAALFFLLYAIRAAVRAARRRQDGGILFLAGFVVLLLAAANDMLSRFTIVPTPALMQYGMLTFIFLQSVILSSRFSRSFAQVELLSDRLLSLDKLKDEFLAKTSHELRTPLFGIMGLTETLMDGAAGPPSPQAARLLQLIKDSSRRLSHLINDILDFAKLKNNDLHLRTAVVDAARMTELVLLLLKPMADKKGLALRSDIPGDGRAFVLADENRLQQILHNLIGNAIKFTDFGTVAVSAERSGAFVTIRVADTGIGIPASETERIFESFEQLEHAMERRHDGTGIGLAIAKQLVKLQGGDIGVTSTVGVGSVFYFTLPAASGEELPTEWDERPADPVVRIPALQESADEVAATAPAPETRGDPNAPLVLIVDDDPINVQVLSNYVFGPYRVIDTCSGLDAERWIREGVRPDLVLLDLMMPHVTGFDVARYIRARYSSAEMPILFLSARNQIADVTTAFELGANDYIVKPANKQELLARIAMQLRLAQWNRSLEEELALRTSRLEAVMRENAKAMAEMSVLEERNRIARDIHDQVGHTLTASIVQLEAALLLAGKDGGMAVERLQTASELVRQGVKEMRQSVHTLHEQSARLSLYSAMVKLIQEAQRHADVVIEHDIEPLERPLPPDQEKLLYRALQEGITNGIRHGKSKRFRCEMKTDGQYIVFTLENDGLPFAPGPLGLGLSSMKRQAEQWRGTFRIGAAPPAGCRLTVALPIERS